MDAYNTGTKGSSDSAGRQLLVSAKLFIVPATGGEARASSNPLPKLQQRRRGRLTAGICSPLGRSKLVANRTSGGRGETIFSQGDACKHVLYIQAGGVKLSVLSKTGKEAVVAMLGPGDFFGEGCLAGQPVRMGSATAMTASVILLVGKRRMVRLLHQQPAMSDRFITHMLSRNVRIEEDLIDQLFNSSEKRLARTLLLLARYGKQDEPARVVPKVSQETLAKMVGTTRSRVNFFLNKYKKMGFIEYNGDIPLKINSSLLSVVLHD